MVTIKNIREKNPIIHNITNYVTVNDCANILLACGASPIMADEIEEMEDIVKISNGLNINIGTLNARTVESMIFAGKLANKMGHTITLDPVGVGASTLRGEVVKRLLKEVKFSVICGNISEIKALALGTLGSKGVDANLEDVVTEQNLQNTIEVISNFSQKLDSIIVVTGEIDIIAKNEVIYIVKNGHEMMSKITGTGCMLTALIGGFIAANRESIVESVVDAVCAMGLAGERAKERLSILDGNLTYRNYIIDEIFNMNDEILLSGKKAVLIKQK